MNWEEKYHKLVVETLALKQRLIETEKLLEEKTIIVERMLSQAGKYRA